MPNTVTDPALRERLGEIQKRLAEELPRVDPHRRLAGRPVAYQVIAGRTLEVTYRDVPRIDESELVGMKRVMGTHCVCSITPQTAETLTVRFVVPL